MNKLIQKIKDAGEDWEWYPTTDEIIAALKEDIQLVMSSRHISVLDIGAGNGKVLHALEDEEITLQKYAIEKSKILIESMDKDIFIVGTNFHEQTLIDKKVDIVFCNPPYSEFSIWAEKIIKEANAGYIYLVLPQRWKTQPNILAAIELRSAKSEIIGEFDFENAEDRTARAKVHLIRISMGYIGHRDTDLKKDPFDIWFNENFKFKADKEKFSEYKKEQNNTEKIKAIISKKNLIIELETLYKSDLENIIQNYRMLEKLDSSLFEELNISIGQIKEGLKLRITGLKNVYWKILFDNLDTITNRLTYKSREKLLSTLTENTSVDFTASNAYSIIIWAIKNANEYYDMQLLDLYLSLSSRKNIKLYKSNHRIVEDGWRYCREDMSHYSLDYRIVHYHYDAIITDSWHKGCGMGCAAQNFIQDVFAIAKNLGFDVLDDHAPKQWIAGKGNEFYLKDYVLFAEIKAFKNGNLHFKFIPEFMKKLNIEAARLNGWIKKPEDAINEFDVTPEEARIMFNTNFYLTAKKMSGLIEFVDVTKEELRYKARPSV